MVEVLVAGRGRLPFAGRSADERASETAERWVVGREKPKIRVWTLELRLKMWRRVARSRLTLASSRELRRVFRARKAFTGTKKHYLCTSSDQDR